MRWHNEYIIGTLQRPGSEPFGSPDEAVDKTAFMDGAASTIGTPDDLVKMIKSVYDKSGGFGTVVGFVHDWANPENTMRSWDMVARYVIPEINGYVTQAAQIAEVPDRQSRRLRPRRPGDHGQDHGEQGCRRGAQGHELAALRRRVGFGAKLGKGKQAAE